MNMKSIQMKLKGGDTVLCPLIRLDAALFAALCWCELWMSVQIKASWESIE